MQDSINIPHKSVLALFAAVLVLGQIAVFSSYIFHEANLPLLLVLLIVGAIVRVTP